MNISNDTVVIPLTQGQQTVVSVIDADLAQYRWYALFQRGYGGGGNYTARRHVSAKVESDPRKRLQSMHVIIMERILGRKLDKGEYVDHIDGNPLSNVRENLRLATPGQNRHNSRRMKTNTSGYKGIDWSKRAEKWRARIMIAGKRITLGTFDTPEEAYAAYCEAAKKYHGEFANFG